MPDPCQFLPLAEAERPLLVGIDVGGTNIKIGLLDRAGRTLAYHTIPTDQDRGPEDAARRMGEGFRHVVAEAGAAADEVAWIGLATPGPIDIPTGMILNPGNLQAWHDTPIRDLVSQACGRPVRFANDANAAAYGEYWAGAGREFHSMVLLTLGTGVGGGIITEDQLIEGAHSCGSECGHILIDYRDGARVDTLGKTGSLEAYCGSYGVVGRLEDALAAGRTSSLGDSYRQGEKITPLAIAQAAEQGDELALETVMDTARYLAYGIVTFVHMIDPESVVLGGAMTFGGAGHPLGERFIEQIRQETKRRLLTALRDKVQIQFASLGGDAGYIGAAGLALLEYEKQ